MGKKKTLSLVTFYLRAAQRAGRGGGGSARRQRYHLNTHELFVLLPPE
jgi:hypothetical protein